MPVQASEQGQPRNLDQFTHESVRRAPRHSGDMPKGTLGAILKQPGIDRDEFDAACSRRGGKPAPPEILALKGSAAVGTAQPFNSGDGGRGTVISSVNRATAQPFSGVTPSCTPRKTSAHLANLAQPASLAQWASLAQTRSSGRSSRRAPLRSTPDPKGLQLHESRRDAERERAATRRRPLDSGRRRVHLRSLRVAALTARVRDN
jgi:hypothetical protein